MLSDAERNSFFETGLISLPGFAPRKYTAKIKDIIETEFSRLKLRVNGKYQLAKLQDMPVFQQTTFLSGQVRVGSELENLFTPELLQTMTELAESKLNPAHPFPQLLLSFPHKDEWSLKSLNWHLDYKNSRMDILPGIQPFILIDDILPGGGATLALTGSHRLHKAVPGQNAHGVMRGHGDFIHQPEKFLQPQMVHDVPVQIVEMHGRAGDVFLMDLRVLHTPSINSQKKPRMMTTNRYLKPGLKL